MVSWREKIRTFDRSEIRRETYDFGSWGESEIGKEGFCGYEWSLLLFPRLPRQIIFRGEKYQNLQENNEIILPRHL